MSNVEFPKAASEGLVSIVIPTYRADEYIGQALASISSSRLIVLDARLAPRVSSRR